jgi:DNA-directed RNA polymerase subunit RPC12/RpoP
VSIEESKAKRQRIKLIGAVALLVIAVLLILRYTLGSTSPERFSAERVFKCVDCGHDFEHVIQLGDTEPLPCPKCGKMTAWKAEACYWTKDAAGNWKAKLNPTYVVLKSRVDPNTTEKTYCPDKDCGHVVVGHNPKPSRDLMEAAQKEAGK